MLYEIRLYTIVPGRLDVALNRFERHLPALFARHGIRNLGSWIATAGSHGPMFVYIMAYRSLAEREAQWNGFYADPEWASIRAATQGEEEATERFEIIFAKAHAWHANTQGGLRDEIGVHDLLLAQIGLGQNSRAEAYLRGTYLPAIEAAGGRIMMVADVLTGPALPQVAIMVAWDDAALRQRAWTALATSATLQAAIAQQRQEGGRALMPRIDTFLLQPTEFRRVRAPFSALSL